MIKNPMTHIQALFEGHRKETIPHPALAPTPPASSTPAAAPRETSQPRRLGLALGGGGGKGGAHLGVLAVLEQAGVSIDVMAGTSIGGAVAILYAAGLSIADIQRVFPLFDLRKTVSSDPSRTGFIGNRKREALMRDLLGDKTFADLRIPCAVVSVDLVSGEEVILDQGSLVEAILATTALPGIFPPIIRDQQMLTDGGVLNNLPITQAESMGAQRVIAVQLGPAQVPFTPPPPVPEQTLPRLMLAPRQLQIAGRALEIITGQVAAFQLAQHPPALLLAPDVHEISIFDMTRIEEGYQIGQAAATEQLAVIEELRDWRLTVEVEEEPVPETIAPPKPAESSWRLQLPQIRFPGRV